VYRGYVKLWRKSVDSPIWGDWPAWGVWTWCLMKATHAPHGAKVRKGNGLAIIALRPGQFVFGRNVAAEELHMPPSSVRNNILKLEKLGMLDRSSEGGYSVVTICNWELYADLENSQNDQPGQRDGRSDGRSDGRPDGHVTRTEKNKETQRTKDREQASLFPTTPDTPPAEEEEKKPPRTVYPPEFDIWWKAFPKLRRSDKRKTLAAWKRAVVLIDDENLEPDRKAAIAHLLERTVAFAASPACSRSEIDYVKHSFRWLDAGHYDDDPTIWEHKHGRRAKVDDSPARIRDTGREYPAGTDLARHDWSAQEAPPDPPAPGVGGG
jgi:hypothetical protein